jgi:hypothetical protein
MQRRIVGTTAALGGGAMNNTRACASSRKHANHPTTFHTPPIFSSTRPNDHGAVYTALGALPGTLSTQTDRLDVAGLHAEIVSGLVRLQLDGHDVEDLRSQFRYRHGL